MLAFPNIDPVAFRVGEFAVRWYSLAYVFGALSAYTFLRTSLSRHRLRMNAEQVETALIFGLAGMLVGARIVFVVFYNFHHYLYNPLEAFAIWKGGLSFHGGLAGASLAAYLYCKRQGLSLLNLGDHAALVAPVGLGLARVANFVNGEQWGKHADPETPWAMVFPAVDALARHPAQLYDALLLGFALFGVLWAIRLGRPKDGVLSGTFVLTYGVFSFFLGFFKERNILINPSFGPISLTQFLDLVMWILGAWIILYALGRKAWMVQHPEEARYSDVNAVSG